MRRTLLLLAFTLTALGCHSSQPPPPPKPPASPSSATPRHAGFLSEYSVRELSMVGYLIGREKTWAFLAAPDGTALKIKKNDSVGKEGAKVTAIEADQTTLLNPHTAQSILIPLDIGGLER